MATRRGLLAAAALLPLAGCSGDPLSAVSGVGGGETRPEGHDPVRGESDASVETEFVEDDEDVEYVEDEHAVQYVAAERRVRSEDGVERSEQYATTPFEDWASMECRHAAAQAAAEHAESELDAGSGELGWGSSTVDGRSVATVSVSTLLDRSGDVISRPPVEFEKLLPVTPGTVTATYTLGDQQHTTEIPVYVVHSVAQQQ